MAGDIVENRLCLVVSKKERGVNYTGEGYKVLNLKNVRRYIGDDTPEKLEMQTLILQLIYYDEITVKVKVKGDGAVMIITVTDKNKPFSFNNTINFRNKEDYDGGLGAEIFKENRNRLHFNYQDGWNVYKVRAPMKIRHSDKKIIKARNYVSSNFVGW